MPESMASSPFARPIGSYHPWYGSTPVVTMLWHFFGDEILYLNQFYRLRVLFYGGVIGLGVVP